MLPYETTASHWFGQQNSWTVKLVDATYDGRARGGLMHKVYYTLVDHKVLTPLLLFVVDLYNLSLYSSLCSIWQDFD